MIDVRTYGAVPDGTTDCTSAINTAITAGDIIIKNGVFLLSESIKIPSNRTMYLKNCEVKMADASNDNFFRNSDFEGGNVNIHVIGQGNVLFNARAAYQDNAFQTYGPLDPPSDTLYRYIGIVMCNVNGFSIKNINITQTMKWQVLFEKASNGIVSNVYLAHQYSGGNQDGFDIAPNCNNIIFSNCKGYSGDDFTVIAVGKEIGIFVNITNWNVGDNHDLTFNDCYAYATPYRAVLLIGEATNNIYNIIYNNYKVKTCQYFLLNYNDLYTTPPTTDSLKDVTFNGVTVDANTGAHVLRILEDCSNIILTDYVNNSGKTDLEIEAGRTVENFSINGIVYPKPVVSTATVEDADRDKVVITFSLPLDDSYVPATTDFALAGKTITGIAVVGAVVTLTVSVAYANGNVITVDYTKPVSNYLRDGFNAIVDSFADQAVTNNIAASFPTDGLIGRWSMDGDATDSSGNGLDLTNTNGVLTTNRFDESDKAYDLNGTSAFLTRAAFTEAQLADRWTVAIWFKADDLTNYDYLIAYSDPATSGNGWGIIYLTTGTVYRFFINNWNTGGVANITFTDTTGWHCLIASYDKDILDDQNMKFSIDNGAPVTLHHHNAVANWVSAQFLIGKGAATGFFNGKIGETALWNRQLTPAEKTAVFNSVI